MNCCIALTKLIKRVKKLEHTVKTSLARRRAKVVISDAEEDEGDPSKQRRSLIKELDMDARISLVPPHVTDQGRFDDTHASDQPEEQLGVFSAAQVLTDASEQRRGVENVQTYTRRRSFRVSTGNGGVSSASELVSTAGVKAKDKGKAVMQESEPLKKIKKFNAEQEARFKAEQEQEMIDFETPLKLQKQLDERKEVIAEATQTHDIDWSDPANQGGYKMSHFKGMSYEDIRPIFERVWDQTQSFIPMDSEKEKDSEKKAGGSRKKTLARKRADEKQSDKSDKRQKKKDDAEKEEFIEYLNIVPEEGMHVEALQTKYPLIDLEIYTEDSRVYWKIIRVGDHTEIYQFFEDMLKNFDRDDLVKL
ncbi:hypothetical protein Tco_1412960 [Tanacetum coccineum]